MVFQIGLRCGAEWGRAVQCVSVFLAGRVAEFAEFLKNRRKNLFRFSGVVIRVSKFSMMSLKDRKAVSTHCGSASERGVRSVRVLR